MPVADNSAEQNVSIANGQTTSDALYLGADTVVGVITPAALTSTALTFEGSPDGTTWYTVLGFDGATFSQTVTTSKGYPLPPGIFAMYDYVRVVGGSAEGGARTLTLLTMPGASVPPNSRTTLSTGTAAIGKLAANDGVDIGDVTINNALPTTIYNGKTTVTTAGTRVVLAASQAITSGVRIKAAIANTGTIYVGNSSVASTNGFELAPGEEVFIEIANLNTVNLDASANSQSVTYVAV